MIPETAVQIARRWAMRQVPARARDQMRVEIDVSDRAITVLECRAPWPDDPGPEWSRLLVARLRYVQSRREWTLYWPDSNLRFHRYEDFPPTPDLGELLNEIGNDPTGIFWG